MNKRPVARVEKQRPVLLGECRLRWWLICVVFAAVAVGCKEPMPELKILRVEDKFDGTAEVKYKIRIIDGSKCDIEVQYWVEGRGLAARDGGGR